MLQRVFERLAVVLNGHVVLAVCALGRFRAADDLRGDAEGFALGDDAGCGFGIAIDFHAVAHVVHAEHFFRAGVAGLLDRGEDRRDRQEVVLDVMHACAEADALGLTAAGAVHHAVNVVAVFGEELLDDRRVGAGRAHDRVADCHARVGERIGHFVRAAVKELLIRGGVHGLGIFLEIIRAEQVMARAGQAVAANARVFKVFVGGLAGRSETDDGQAWLDVGVVDHVRAVHHHHGAGIDGHGAGQVADVGGLAAAAVHADAVLTQRGEKVFGAGNKLAERFAGNGAGVAVDSA